MNTEKAIQMTPGQGTIHITFKAFPSLAELSSHIKPLNADQLLMTSSADKGELHRKVLSTRIVDKQLF